MSEPLTAGLSPLIFNDSRVLILGSFPSIASLELGQYYGFPRNQFWLLAASVFSERVPADWPNKRALLSRHGIALWDVTASCVREGSLDQAIRDAVPNPIPGFLRGHANVERVVVNGAKAAELFSRFFLRDPTVVRDGGFTLNGPVPLAPAAINWVLPDSGGRSVVLQRVPSSSPVPSREYRCATDKLSAWRAAIG